MICALARELATRHAEANLLEAETATWNLNDAREAFAYARVLKAKW